MNKEKINREIEYAYEALKKCGIARGAEIDKGFRGQIASFGAAVSMGSLLPAIAFFEQRGGADVDRPALMKAILYVLQKEEEADSRCGSLYEYARENPEEKKETILNAAIAVKLAMNLYILK